MLQQHTSMYILPPHVQLIYVQVPKKQCCANETVDLGLVGFVKLLSKETAQLHS